MSSPTKVKRFALMAGATYYAEGGFNDYINSYDTREEATIAMQAWLDEAGEYHWAHVGDIETGEFFGKGRAEGGLGALLKSFST